MVNERLLYWVEPPVLGQSLDSDNVCAIGTHCQYQARAGHLPIHQDRTGATHPNATALFGAGQSQVVAQAVDQQALGRYFQRLLLAVYSERNRLSHVVLPPC
jgi:hypothetical protein